MQLYMEPQITQNQALNNDWNDKRRRTQHAWFRYNDKCLKAGWVKRRLHPQAQSWKTIPFSLLDSVGGALLFTQNISLILIS